MARQPHVAFQQLADSKRVFTTAGDGEEVVPREARTVRVTNDTTHLVMPHPSEVAFELITIRNATGAVILRLRPGGATVLEFGANTTSVVYSDGISYILVVGTDIA